MNKPASNKNLETTQSIADLVKRFKADGLKPASRKICWVTDELLGLYRNGGAGTVTSGFCEATIAAGHDLTILYTSRVDLDSFTNKTEVEKLQNAGYKIIFLQEVASPSLEHQGLTARSFYIDRWLRDQDFDIVHFHEFNGSGHFACLAKKQGLAHQNTLLCMTIHGSTRWAWECMEYFINSPSDLERDYIERKSIENADYVLCYSRHMAHWLSRNATRLPVTSYVQPSIMPTVNIPRGVVESAVLQGSVNEIVFFGRQEVRKGMRIFVEAAEILSRSHPGLKFTFLGKFSLVDFEHSGAYVFSRLSHIPNEISFLADFDRDEALRYIKRPECLAVMPSVDENFPCTVFEAILEGVEFIATKRGGIPEIVHPDCHADRLFEFSGHALAEAVTRIVSRRPPRARLAFDQTLNTEAWIDWHALVPLVSASPSAAKEMPLVSLCIVHYNRPRLLGYVIEAVQKQSYRNIEVVLVDDGSPSQEAIDYVAQLEKKRFLFPFRVVRSPDVGLAAARNAAVAEAKGEYLVFIDDDNVPLPNMVEKMVMAVVTRKLDFATAMAYVLDGDGSPPSSTEDAVTEYFPAGGPLSLGLINNVFGDANAIMRRSAFLALGGFEESRGVGAEDWDLYARAALEGRRLEVIGEPLYWYRRHSGQLTARPHSRHAYFERLLRSYWAHMSDEGSHEEIYEAIKTYQGRFVEEKLRGELWEAVGGRREGELQQQLMAKVWDANESRRLLVLLASRLGRFRDAAKLMVSRDNPASHLAAFDSEIAEFYRQPGYVVLQGVYGEESAVAAPRAAPILRSYFPQTRYVTTDKGNFAWDPLSIDYDNGVIGVHPLPKGFSAARIVGAIAAGATGVSTMVFVDNPKGPAVRFHLIVAHPSQPWLDSGEMQNYASNSRVVAPVEGRQQLSIKFTEAATAPLDLLLVTESIKGNNAYAWARFGSFHLLFGDIASLPAGERAALELPKMGVAQRWFGLKR